MRRTTTTIALASALLLAVPAGALADTEGATIDKTGWWNRASSATPTPAGPVTVPPPGVPEGDLTVSRLGDEATAISAIGIQPEEGPGATVESFTLTLREDPDARANRSPEQAAVLACPITSFWAGGENGSWDTRPEHDCDAASAAGVRSDDGTWTFDLAAIGALWFDTFGTIRADGVALVPDDATEGSFQVVWQGGDAIDVALRAEPAEAEAAPFATPPSSEPPPAAGASSGAAGAASGGGSSIFSPPRVTTPPTIATPPAADPSPAVAEPEPDAAADELAGAPIAADGPRGTRAGTLVGNLPPAGLALVPLALATLLAMSYWLGPNGQPSTTDRRGGVSRALALRARTAQER